VKDLRIGMQAGFLWESQKERDNWEDVDVCEGIIF
jgi:hypothetical protein